MKAADVRAALIEAGLELLRENGVEPAINVTLADAIERAGVPRSSAYASLAGEEGSPRDRFYSELLTRVDTAADPSGTLAEMNQVLVDHAEDLESKDPKRLGSVVREVVRRGVGVNVREVADRTEWRILQASLAALGAQPRSEEVDEQLRQLVEVQRAAPFIEGYQTLLQLFGLRLIEPMKLETFAKLALYIVESVALRVDFDDDLDQIERPTGLNGETQLWNAAAIGFEGLMLTWVEPDPRLKVTADISWWVR